MGLRINGRKPEHHTVSDFRKVGVRGRRSSMFQEQDVRAEIERLLRTSLEDASFTLEGLVADQRGHIFVPNSPRHVASFTRVIGYQTMKTPAVLAVSLNAERDQRLAVRNGVMTTSLLRELESVRLMVYARDFAIDRAQFVLRAWWNVYPPLPGKLVVRIDRDDVNLGRVFYREMPELGPILAECAVRVVQQPGSSQVRSDQANHKQNQSHATK